MRYRSEMSFSLGRTGRVRSASNLKILVAPWSILIGGDGFAETVVPGGRRGKDALGEHIPTFHISAPYMGKILKDHFLILFISVYSGCSVVENPQNAEGANAHDKATSTTATKSIPAPIIRRLITPRPSRRSSFVNQCPAIQIRRTLQIPREL